MKIKNNLRAKVIFWIVIPLILILGIFSVFDYYQSQTTMLNNLSIVASETGNIIETALKHEMLESDFAGIQRILDAFYDGNSFERLYILDSSGEIIFAPYSESVGKKLSSEEEECQPCHTFIAEERPNSIVITKENGEYLFRSMKPIFNSPECVECHEDDGKIIGLLLNDISIVPYNNILINNLKAQMLRGIVIIALTGFIVYFTLSQYVLRGIEKLAIAVSDFSYGREPEMLANSGEDEIGQLATSFYKMAVDVQTRYSENQELSMELEKQNMLRGKLLGSLITSQEDERKRLARDLHDKLGQVLGGLALKNQLIVKILESDPLRAIHELGQMSKLIEITTDKMYDLIKDLRPSLLDDMGLIPAIKDYARRTLEDTNIEISITDSELNQRLHDQIEVAVYRVFQEALHNSVKHSNATEIVVNIMIEKHQFICEIIDNGKGFDINSILLEDEHGTHYGLLGMNERVLFCDGILDILSSKGNGTTVRIIIPLKEANYG